MPPRRPDSSNPSTLNSCSRPRRPQQQQHQQKKHLVSQMRTVHPSSSSPSQQQKHQHQNQHQHQAQHAHSRLHHDTTHDHLPAVFSPQYHPLNSTQYVHHNASPLLCHARASPPRHRHRYNGSALRKTNTTHRHHHSHQPHPHQHPHSSYPQNQQKEQQNHNHQNDNDNIEHSKPQKPRSFKYHAPGPVSPQFNFAAPTPPYTTLAPPPRPLSPHDPSRSKSSTATLPCLLPASCSYNAPPYPSYAPPSFPSNPGPLSSSYPFPKSLPYPMTTTAAATISTPTHTSTPTPVSASAALYKQAKSHAHPPPPPTQPPSPPPLQQQQQQNSLHQLNNAQSHGTSSQYQVQTQQRDSQYHEHIAQPLAALPLTEISNGVPIQSSPMVTVATTNGDEPLLTPPLSQLLALPPNQPSQPLPAQSRHPQQPQAQKQHQNEQQNHQHQYQHHHYHRQQQEHEQKKLPSSRTVGDGLPLLHAPPPGRPTLYDIAKLHTEYCNIITGKVYNEDGHNICGVLRKHGKPCKRVGNCPFHGLSTPVTAENSCHGHVDAEGNAFLEISGPYHPSDPSKGSSGPATMSLSLPPSSIVARLPPRKMHNKLSWSKEEHYMFLKGLEKFKRGSCTKISMFVKTRTPAQVHSHAQKYFLRQGQSKKNKRTINDLSMDSEEMREVARSLKYLDAHMAKDDATGMGGSCVGPGAGSSSRGLPMSDAFHHVGSGTGHGHGKSMDGMTRHDSAPIVGRHFVGGTIDDAMPSAAAKNCGQPEDATTLASSLNSSKHGTNGGQLRHSTAHLYAESQLGSAHEGPGGCESPSPSASESTAEEVGNIAAESGDRIYCGQDGAEMIGHELGGSGGTTAEHMEIFVPDIQVIITDIM